MDRKKELYSSVFFIILSIVYFIGALNIKSYSPFGNVGINSSTIPKVLGGSLFILSILNYFNSYKLTNNDNKDNLSEDKKQSVFDQSMEAEEELESASTENKKATIFTFIFLIIFALFLESVGFILMSTFFLICQMTLLTPKDLRKKKFPFISILSVIFVVLVYFIFTKGLSLILPTGIIG